MKVGDVVVITKTPEAYEYYSVGDRARLIKQYEDGDWFADFTINETYFEKGVWFIQPGMAECEVEVS